MRVKLLQNGETSPAADDFLTIHCSSLLKQDFSSQLIYKILIDDSITVHTLCNQVHPGDQGTLRVRDAYASSVEYPLTGLVNSAKKCLKN